MYRLWAYLVLLVMTCCVPPVAMGGGAWHDAFYPYRIRIQLDSKYSGKIRLAPTSESIIDQLQCVSIDPLSMDTLAFERAVLVDSTSGLPVGRFVLKPVGEPLPVDGGFAAAQGADSSWQGFDPRSMRIETVRNNGRDLSTLRFLKRETADYQKLSRPITLKPECLYLMSYWVYMDADESPLTVTLADPNATLFPDLHSSYKPKITPRGKWTHQTVVVRPQVADAELRISHASKGVNAVADIRIQEVELALEAELPEPSDALDLYCVARAGHRLPSPDAMEKSDRDDIPVAEVRSLDPEAIDFNPGGVLFEGAAADLWTVPSYLPLRADDIRKYRPTSASPRSFGVVIPRGGASTLLVAVDTNTPRAMFENIHSSLPLDIKVERLAEVPVYDGPFPRGRHLEQRFDPRVPLNWELIPASSTGIHLLAITFTVPVDIAPGTYRDKLVIGVTTQEPRIERFELAVEVRVLPPVVKPMRHFGTLFAGQHFMVRYDTSYFDYQGKSVADFHGLEWIEGGRADPVARVNSPDLPHPDLSAVRHLADAYYHSMVDHFLLPQTPLLYAGFTYDVVPQDEGKAPLLQNWSFDKHDEKLEEFVIDRDMPWLSIFHDAGHSMHILKLNDGISYSFEPAPDDNTPWVQLSKKEYFRLVADYFEAIAAHLAEKAVLDRAIYVVDESLVGTWDLIREYIEAVRSRPHASQIKFGFTNYEVAQFIRRDKEGKVSLAEVIDVSMPDQDDHFNNFEPEWNLRQDPQPEHQWVYYVESDHFVLEQAGLSTIVTPLKLEHFGADGWYCWASFIWHMPYKQSQIIGPKYPVGPTVNPWLNPYNHHGHGIMTFYWPPDPRGLPPESTDLIVPSYRLSLMRDGIQLRAMQELLRAGSDDAGNTLEVNASVLEAADHAMDSLWADNPVQWYLSYGAYKEVIDSYYGAGRN